MVRFLGAGACGAAAAIGSAFLWRRRDEGKPLRALQPDTALMCPLQSKQQVGKDSFLLRFGLPSPEHVLGLPVPGHVMLVDDAFIYRPYSPVTVDATTKGHFDLLVKRYPGGEISTQLARMRVGDLAHVRGPCGSDFTYQRDDRKAPRLGMVAAGTGITPMWQVIQTVLDDPEDDTQIRLVYANRSTDDILLKPELDAARAKHPSRFSVCYVVSRAAEGSSPPEGVSVGRVDEALLRAQLPPPTDSKEERCHLLVCGPESMLRALCGPKQRDGPTPPGQQVPPLAGVLAKMGYRNGEVTCL
jgi:NAD(P)H-flavin reductase